MKNDELKCPECGGDGIVLDEYGDGSIREFPCESCTEPKEQDVCPECGGEKYVYDGTFSSQEACGSCNGTGKAPVDNIRVKDLQERIYRKQSEIERLKTENEAMKNSFVKLTTKYRKLGDSGALFIINELKELTKGE